MGFETGALVRTVELFLDAPAGATLNVYTNFPGTAMALRESRAIAATSGRQVRKITLAGTTKGKLWRWQITSAGTVELLGGRIHARPLGGGGWQWIPLPIRPTSQDWQEIPLPIPQTPDEWTSIKLPIPETPDGWAEVKLPIPETPDGWAEVKLPIPETPDGWQETPVPIPQTPDEWTSIKLPIPETPDGWQEMRVPIEQTPELPALVDVDARS